MQLSHQRQHHEIKCRLLKPEDEVLVTPFLQTEAIKDQTARLGQRQSSRQRGESWASVSIQLTSLPLAGYNLLVEPALPLTLPHVQCEEHPVFKTLQGLIPGRN